MYDITPLIKQISETVKKHRLDVPGAYCRRLWQNDDNPEMLGINEYGCADAINILYTITEMPSETDREAYINVLQSLQNPETGLFTEKTHHPIHTTAHCTAALELLDAKPLYPLFELQKYLDKKTLYSFLDNLNWKTAPWTESHKGAGIYAALVLSGEANSEWQQIYFDWFWENADSETGFWRKNMVVPHKWEQWVSVFPVLAGSFHYLFNHEYAKMPLRYPGKMLDSCIDIFQNKKWPMLGKQINFAEVDWIYCLNRSRRQTPHRFEEATAELKKFADIYIPYLMSVNYETDEDFNDMHMLFGMTCALAELQQALPGYIHTEKPLRLVLDRRPFI